MNLAAITQTIAEKAKAGQEAQRFQTVLTSFEKASVDNGFESYSDFLSKLAAYEPAGEPPATAKQKAPAAKTSRKTSAPRKKRTTITAELVMQMKAMHEANTPPTEIATKLDISRAVFEKYKGASFNFFPRVKTSEQSASATATSIP